MRFECSHCGKKYSSADEPTPGRVYVIGCKCGHSIVVKGPEKPHPGVAARAPVPAPAPPVAPRAPPPPPPAASDAARRPATLVTPAPSPAPGVGAAPFPEAGARRGRAGPSLDPFADMQEHSGQAGARPLADVPEIKGPIPEPTPQPRSFDPFAAQQGLLLEEDVARAIQGGTAPPATSDEVPITFSDQLPAAPAARAAVLPTRVERAVPQPRPARRPSRLAAGVAIAAVALAAAAGASWFYFVRPPSGRAPAPAAAPAPPAPVAAPAPAPAPPAPKAAAPIPAPAPAPVAVQQPPAEVAPAPAPAPAPSVPARPSPEREPPKRVAATRAPKKAPVPAPEPVVATAPPAREPAPPLPPPPREPPQREPAKPKAPPTAPDRSASDQPPARKEAAPPPAAAGRSGEGLTPTDVEAAVRKNRKAFDGCVEDAVRNEPGLQVLGRRVGLYLTVNPSGIVTAPRLDDPELLDTELGACLKSTARKMVFPQFQGDPFQVKVPLVLGRE